MKIHPPVCQLLSLGLCVALLACGVDNGTLFPALPAVPSDGAQDPPVAAEPEPEPAPAPESEDPDGSEPSGADLPLDGEVTRPVRPSQPEPEPAEPQPEPEPSGPVIVEVSPADGANAISGDTSIVLRFSEPMDQAATEAAYQSESVPSASVSFVWDEDDTLLTIVPEAPLVYDSGTDPALVQARRINYFISASAQSREGVRLAQPYEFSFSLLRQLERLVFALQNRDLSGSFRSNDTYGSGQCARGEINMCVGDQRVQGENEQYRGFMSFDLGPLPPDTVAVSALLNLQITGMSGNPFAGLGGLVLEHTRFDSIGLDAFSGDALEELGLIASAGAAGTTISADVSAAIVEDGFPEQGSEPAPPPLALSQFRLRFEDATDDDNTADAIISAWDTQSLDLLLLVP